MASVWTGSLKTEVAGGRDGLSVNETGTSPIGNDWSADSPVALNDVSLVISVFTVTIPFLSKAFGSAVVVGGQPSLAARAHLLGTGLVSPFLFSDAGGPPVRETVRTRQDLDRPVSNRARNSSFGGCLPHPGRNVLLEPVPGSRPPAGRKAFTTGSLGIPTGQIWGNRNLGERYPGELFL